MGASRQVLASYLPAFLIDRLAGGSSPAAAHGARRSAVAVLQADIVGFTKLAERLARRGGSGIEELSEVLNAAFDPLVRAIHRHGGEVLKFAGDAALAIWPADSAARLPDQLLLAAQCGLEIQRAFSLSASELSVRVGIGAGTARLAVVGGVEQRWEYLAIGAPLRRLACAGGHARPGEVVLAPGSWQRIAGRCRLEAAPGGCRRLDLVHRPVPPRALSPRPLDGVDEASLRAFIPRSVTARLDRDQSEWLAEFRSVTVLFANIRGLALEKPGALERLQPVMTALQREVYRYDGSVTQFLVDDKGTVLLAVWGLPSRTHEDDSARGLRAAWAIHNGLRQSSLESSIGLATGRVFCGIRGNADRREYAVIGRVVNLAARLMQHARGGVLCDQPTAGQAGQRLPFAVTARPAIKVKGKDEPVAVHRLDAPARGSEMDGPDAGTPRRSLVGRRQELARLDQMLDDLSAGASGVLFIEGEAGLGKSHLVAELLARARGRGLATLIGSGDSIEGTTPYHAWRPVLHTLFDGDPRAGEMLLASQVMERLDRRWHDYLPLLATLLGLDLPETDATRSMDARARRETIGRLTLELLAGWPRSGEPRLLVLEDAHWLDSASWDLARFLSRQLRPLLLVMATRPMDDPPEQAIALSSSSAATHMRLGMLAESEIENLLTQSLGVDEVPNALTQLIWQRAEGHPYYSIEVAYALRDTGVIETSSRACRVRGGYEALESVNLPTSIEAVITSRLDVLDPAQQLTLKVASVLGRDFDLEALLEVHPHADAERLRADLEVVQRLDLAEMDRPGGTRRYLFKHAITQQVAYNLLPFAQRRQLHRSAAEWYETQSGAADRMLTRLAYHWRLAIENREAQEPELADRALGYQERAGDRALRLSSYREAKGFFDDALRLEPVATGREPAARRRARLLVKTGEAHMGLGALPAGRDHLERAATVLGRPFPKSRAGLILSLLGQAGLQVSRRLFSRRPVADEERKDLLEAVRLHSTLSFPYWVANEQQRNFHRALRMLNLAEAAGASLDLVTAYAHTGYLMGALGLHRLAETYFRLGLASADELEEPLPAKAYIFNFAALYRSGIGGQWRRAHRDVARGREILQQAGDWFRWGGATATAGNAALCEGDVLRSRELYGELHAKASRLGNTLHQAWATYGVGASLLRMGDVEGALAQIRDSLSHCEGKAERLLEVCIHGSLALALCRQGRYAEARRSAETAERVIAGLPPRPAAHYLLEGFAALAEVRLMLFEAAGATAEEDVDQAEGACRRLSAFARVFAIGQPQAWLFLGTYDWLRARPASARRRWRRSLSFARRLQMPYDLARTHLEIGRRLGAGDPASVEHLAKARQQFSRLGIVTESRFPIDPIPAVTRRGRMEDQP